MQRDNSQIRVLVTGGTGYLAGHIIYYLLERGYNVRATVRSLKDTKKSSHLYQIFPSKKGNLELVEADLLNRECWDATMKDVEYVIHSASPFPSVKPKNADDLIRPAVEGTESILEAAIRQGVKKVVLTSSIASVFAGQDKKNHFTESDWSNLATSPPYEKSKCMAEKKAWEIYERNKDKFQLTVMLPGIIQGPCLHSNAFTSGDFVVKSMKDQIPGIPKVSFAIVDVRDVALAHVQALDSDKLELTNGKRYLIVEGSYWMFDLIQVLKEEFKQYKYKFPSFTVNSSILLSLAGCFDPQVELIKPLFGKMITFDNTLSRKELGIQYANHRKTIIDAAYDLILRGIIPNRLTKEKMLELENLGLIPC